MVENNQLLLLLWSKTVIRREELLPLKRQIHIKSTSEVTMEDNRKKKNLPEVES